MVLPGEEQLDPLVGQQPLVREESQHLVTKEPLGRAGVYERDRHPGATGCPPAAGNDGVQVWVEPKGVPGRLHRHHHPGAEPFDFSRGRTHQLLDRLPRGVTQPAGSSR